MRKWLTLPVVLLFAPVVIFLEAVERRRFPGEEIDDPFWPWFKRTYVIVEKE